MDEHGTFVNDCLTCGNLWGTLLWTSNCILVMQSLVKHLSIWETHFFLRFWPKSNSLSKLPSGSNGRKSYFAWKSRPTTACHLQPMRLWSFANWHLYLQALVKRVHNFTAPKELLLTKASAYGYTLGSAYHANARSELLILQLYQICRTAAKPRAVLFCPASL